MNKPAVHYQSIRDGGKMFLRGIFLKHRIESQIGGGNLFVPVLISKKGRLVRLRHRAQKDNTEKQRCSYFIDAGARFDFFHYAVKIRIFR